MPAQRLSVSEQFASTQIKKKHAEIFRKEAFSSLQEITSISSLSLETRACRSVLPLQ
jgi:hypothetical protein